MRCGWCVLGGAIPRSRDGVNATGRIRETSGSSKRVFFLQFIRGVRSARSRSRATRGFGRWDRFHPRPRPNGGSVVRWTSFVRSVVAIACARCATGRSDHIHHDGFRVDPVRRLSPSVFVARAIASRSIGSVATPTYVDALDDERHGRTRARGKPAANRDSDVWDRFGGSQLENVPPLP